MKKVEVKKIGVISAFKATLYVSIIPMALMFVIGLFMFIIGLIVSESSLVALGISYIVLPVFFLGFYGVFSMLISLVYNKLSSKFGGLEIVLEEKQ